MIADFTTGLGPFLHYCTTFCSFPKVRLETISYILISMTARCRALCSYGLQTKVYTTGDSWRPCKVDRDHFKDTFFQSLCSGYLPFQNWDCVCSVLPQSFFPVSSYICPFYSFTEERCSSYPSQILVSCFVPRCQSTGVQDMGGQFKILVSMKPLNKATTTPQLTRVFILSKIYF